MIAAFVLFLYLAAFPAQVARQGDPDAKPSPTAFHSPMILEVPFVAADRSTWGQGWQTPKEYLALGDYSVDGVALHGREMRGRRESGLAVRTVQKGDRAEVTIRVTAWNPPHNHDKAVSVYFEILNGTQSAGTAQLKNPIGVDDNGSPQSGSVTVSVPVDALKTNPITTLKLTVAAKDW